MAAFVNTISPRTEVSTRSNQASGNGPGTVARARACRSQVGACAKTGPLVFHAPRQTSLEEFAVPARFTQSRGTKLSGPGDRKTRQRLWRRLYQDGLQRRLAARDGDRC